MLKILCGVAALACSAMSWAAGPSDYLPLAVGNLWVLETSSPDPEILTVEVHRSRTINGQSWFLVSGYGAGDRWLRTTAEGAVYVLDERNGSEELVSRLTAGAVAYSTALSGCTQTANPAPVPAPFTGPRFRFDDALAVSYDPGGCRDIGIIREVYAPSTGLVHRSVTTIRGALEFDLVYARINGRAVTGKSGELVLPYNFHFGSKGWLAGFADYSLQTSDLRMLAELRPLPDELGPGQGFYIQGMNRSDDLFMFLKKPVSTEDGLAPNTEYRVSFDIRMASDAPTGCSGVGGAPGEGVYLKAGASADEPVAVLEGSGDIRLNVDKGQQAEGGKDAGVAGTIENGMPCDLAEQRYVRLRKQYAHPRTLRTDERGALWLMVGTDSAYEGLTGLYFESITVRIDAAAELTANTKSPRPGHRIVHPRSVAGHP